jgi:hypothetical protein
MDISKTNLERLQNEMQKAEDVYFEVRRRRQERENVLMTEMRKVLEAEFGAEMASTGKSRYEAEQACKIEADCIRKLESEASLPYPLGTVLKEWVWHGGYFERSESGGRYRLTGRVAVLEIFKDGDELPRNVRWGKPHAGQIVLRMTKKDGSRGKDVEVWNDVCLKTWLPEGQNPPRAA